MERLDAAAEHGCCAGQFLDLFNLEAGLVLEEVCGAAACDELEAEIGQTARELL
jgi:hypothetical protein